MKNNDQASKQPIGAGSGCLLFAGMWLLPILFVWIVVSRTSSTALKVFSWIWTGLWTLSLLIVLFAMPSREELDAQHKAEAERILSLDDKQRERELADANIPVLEMIEQLNPDTAQSERSRREKKRQEKEAEETRRNDLERSKRTEREQQERLNKGTCFGDIQCAFDQHWVEAETQCQIKLQSWLEENARFDFRWTDDGFRERKFPTARWVNDQEIVNTYGAKRVMEYRGSALQLQNGFGAYQRASYSCYFDPLTEKLLSARVERLR